MFGAKYQQLAAKSQSWRPLHNSIFTHLYELFAPSMGLLAKSQKLGLLTGLKQFGICPLVWAGCPVKFPEGNPLKPGELRPTNRPDKPNKPNKPDRGRKKFIMAVQGNYAKVSPVSLLSLFALSKPLKGILVCAADCTWTGRITLAL